MLHSKEVRPPGKQFDGDSSIFFDTLQIRPVQDKLVPILQVGNIKDSIKVDVLQKQSTQMSYDDALRIGNINLENTRLNLTKCSFLFEPQIFNSQLKPILYTVPAYESLKVKSEVVQYDTLCQFKAIVQLTLSTGVLKQIQILGELRFIEHKFEGEQNKRMDCCCQLF